MKTERKDGEGQGRKWKEEEVHGEEEGSKKRKVEGKMKR